MSRIAEGFPDSKYALLGASELEVKAWAWADELADIPTAAIIECHRRTGARCARLARDPHWSPSLGDYRATWLDPAWDFWADVNSHAEKNAPAMPMLPEGPRSWDGPGLTAAGLQNIRLRAGKAMICCECYNSAGIALSATLSRDKKLWRCAQDVCGFLLDIERSDEALIRPRLKLSKKAARYLAEEEAKVQGTAKGRATLADIRVAARECELDFEAMKEAELADFSAWVSWFRRTHGSAPRNYAAFTTTWPACEAEMRERFNERLQV